MSGTRFLNQHKKERDCVAAINTELAAFSRNPSLARGREVHRTFEGGLPKLVMAAKFRATYISEYEELGSAKQLEFLEAVFQGKKTRFKPNGIAKYLEPELRKQLPGEASLADIRTIFNSLLARTTPIDEAVAHRNRFCACLLQSMLTPMGFAQAVVLATELGSSREVRVSEGPKYAMMASVQNPQEQDWTRMQGYKLSKHLTISWEKQQASLWGFLDEIHDLRKGAVRSGFVTAGHPHAKRAKITHAQVVYAGRDDCFPVFAGVAGDEVLLFGAPLYTAVHHEIGHLISALRGESLDAEKFTGKAWMRLTNAEEMANIFGRLRSDRVYNTHLGYPVKFDHQTLMQAYSSMFYGRPSEAFRNLGPDSFGSLLELLYDGRRRANLEGGLKDLLREAGNVAREKNWSRYTSIFKARPSGVSQIEAELKKTGRVRSIAARVVKVAAKNVSGASYPASKEFYGTLARVNLKDPKAVHAATLALIKLRLKYLGPKTKKRK